MPQMPDPFSMRLPDKKLNKHELIQAIRQDIIGEIEAIYVYDAHYEAMDDPRAKEIIAHIRDEEKEHVGELMKLLHILDPTEAELFAHAQEHVMELIGEVNDSSSNKEESSKNSPKSVGSLF